MTPEEHNIIIIEDDLSEQKMLKMLFSNSGYNCSLKFIKDGEEAVNFINAYSGKETVDIIFLDLNLPKIPGIEILRRLKNNEYLRGTVVVVLTTTDNRNEVKLAYESGAAGFIRKPVTFGEYEDKFNTILKYWFDICILR